MKGDKKFIRQLILIGFGVTLFWVLFNISSIYRHFTKFLSVISPLLLGILLALIINVPMSALERKLFKPDKDNNYGRIKAKIKRPLALLITLVLMIGALAIVIILLLPQMITTIEQMYEKVPELAEDLSEKIRDSSLLSKFFNTETWTADTINLKIRGALENGEVLFKTLIETMNFATTLFSGLVNLILALFFAIYMLMQKEKLKSQVHRLTRAVFRKDIADRLCYIGRLGKETFSKFITGQTIEAVILGLLCCLGMEIFGFPNALEIGALVMVTAFIPIVGAFVGAAVGAFFIMFTSFEKALWFVLFIIVLQQLEDNLIYPKVVGKTVGLPSLWVLFAVTVGGTVGGVLGMFVAVPTFSVLYCLTRETLVFLEELRAKRDAERAAKKKKSAAEEEPSEQQIPEGEKQPDV